MSYKHEVNRGSIFKNREKDKNFSPDYSGMLNVDGVLYFVDGWINEGKDGKFLGLRIKKRDKQENIEQQNDILEEDVLM